MTTVELKTMQFPTSSSSTYSQETSFLPSGLVLLLQVYAHKPLHKSTAPIPPTSWRKLSSDLLHDVTTTSANLTTWTQNFRLPELRDVGQVCLLNGSPSKHLYHHGRSIRQIPRPLPKTESWQMENLLTNIFASPNSSTLPLLTCEKNPRIARNQSNTPLFRYPTEILLRISHPTPLVRSPAWTATLPTMVRQAINTMKEHECCSKFNDASGETLDRSNSTPGRYSHWTVLRIARIDVNALRPFQQDLMQQFALGSELIQCRSATHCENHSHYIQLQKPWNAVPQD